MKLRHETVALILAPLAALHAGSNGPRPRGFVLGSNWISDLRSSSVDFQQGLDCLLQGNQLVGVALGFGDGSNDMRVEGNRWTKMKEGQPSVKVGKGSTMHLGGDNQREGEDFMKSVESDAFSVVK